MGDLFAVLFWACVVLYALTVAAQIYGQVFGKRSWPASAVRGSSPSGSRWFAVSARGCAASTAMP